LSFNPPAPFTVPAGQLKPVELVVDLGSAPSGTTIVGFVIENSDPDEKLHPKGVELTIINNNTCNLTMISSVTVNSAHSFDACETLVVGSSFTAESSSEVTLSAGSEIELLPEFNIHTGATLDMQVCGKILCSVHDNPMPLNCHPYIDQICATNPECCDTAFDQACLDRVETKCSLSCATVPEN
jgi:hypothetical protein